MPKLDPKLIVDTVDASGRPVTVNIRKELRRALKSMGYFDGWWLGQTPKISDIKIIVHRGKKSYQTGHAWGSFRVAFTIGIEPGTEEVLALIYHEAAHLASPSGAHHGPIFRRTLADGLQSRWPFLRYGSVRLGRTYDADRRIVDQLKQYVRDGGMLL